jgi:hypothetical protein
MLKTATRKPSSVKIKSNIDSFPAYYSTTVGPTVFSTSIVHVLRAIKRGTSKMVQVERRKKGCPSMPNPLVASFRSSSNSGAGSGTAAGAGTQYKCIGTCLLLLPLLGLWTINEILQVTTVLSSSNKKHGSVATPIHLPPVANGTTHWCYLDKKGTGKMFRSSLHMPYAVQWVAGCWSWLERHNQTTTTTSAAAALALDETMYDRFVETPNFPSWNRPYFQAMGIPILVTNHGKESLLPETPQEEDDEHGSKPKHMVYTAEEFGGVKWFGNHHSCGTMRERLWKGLGITPTSAASTQPESSSSASASTDTAEASSSPTTTTQSNRILKIGLVERPARRLIVNSSALSRALQDHYGPDQVHVSYQIISDEQSLVEQATWYYHQDIVLMAHGAGTTNVIFMRPGTHLLELFPHNFFFELYKPLVEECNVHHHWYYDGGDNPWQDFQDHVNQRGKNRNLDIKITWEQLLAKTNVMVNAMREQGP